MLARLFWLKKVYTWSFDSLIQIPWLKITGQHHKKCIVPNPNFIIGTFKCKPTFFLWYLFKLQVRFALVFVSSGRSKLHSSFLLRKKNREECGDLNVLLKMQMISCSLSKLLLFSFKSCEHLLGRIGYLDFGKPDSLLYPSFSSQGSTYANMSKLNLRLGTLF